MSAINGWVFVIIGTGVAVWSSFNESLLFFAVLGILMIIYGLGKIVFRWLASRNHPNIDLDSNQPKHQVQSHVPHYSVAHQQHTHHGSQHVHHAQHHVHQMPVNNRMQHSMHSAPSNLGHSHAQIKICPNCKQQIHVAYRFCPHCGWGV